MGEEVRLPENGKLPQPASLLHSQQGTGTRHHHSNHPNEFNADTGQANGMSKSDTIGEQSLCFLGTFGYLTSRQLTKLLYGATSPNWETHLRYVQRILHAQVTEELVIPLPGRFVTMPTVYTLSGKGYSATTALGMPQRRRIRRSEQAEKRHNILYLQHTMAVTEVLIAAHLLSQTQPGIQVTRLYTERELKRKIFVTLSDRTICLEPDASLEFLLQEDSQAEDVQDFFHLELYRNLPPQDWRFKQKIAGYVTCAESGQHELLFHTPALSVAVIAQTPVMAQTLKRWTEETLSESGQPEQGERFFFRSGDVATASPAELFLTPFWQQPFSDTKTPLIIREELA
jgi:hypothetical protein